MERYVVVRDFLEWDVVVRHQLEQPVLDGNLVVRHELERRELEQRIVVGKLVVERVRLIQFGRALGLKMKCARGSNSSDRRVLDISRVCRPVSDEGDDASRVLL